MLAGDVLSPSLLSKYYRGRQMVEALNAAKLDYATFGNHEFELPLDTLEARIAESNFKWISSNCTEADGTPVRRRCCPGTRCGSRGTRSGCSASRCRAPTGRPTAAPTPTARRTWRSTPWSAQGAELVVGLTHQTIEADRDLLAREPRLDLILGGHEHEAHDSVVSGRHVLKADANSRTAQFVTLWGGKGDWRQAVGLVQDRQPRCPTTPPSRRSWTRWEDSLRARLGPERLIGRTRGADRRARRDRPAAGVAARRPGHRRDARGHRRRRRRCSTRARSGWTT